ncbi:MAG TPA: hypothetical protein VHI13_21950 [Candidatus Kapabacteria bacterium]|nr:hypothetical protein [Candidatus Kapabacteria bacterium]
MRSEIHEWKIDCRKIESLKHASVLRIARSPHAGDELPKEYRPGTAGWMEYAVIAGCRLVRRLRAAAVDRCLFCRWAVCWFSDGIPVLENYCTYRFNLACALKNVATHNVVKRTPDQFEIFLRPMDDELLRHLSVHYCRLLGQTGRPLAGG